MSSHKSIIKIFLLAIFLLPSSGIAEVKEIISEGTYNMGDGETPTVAESRALLNAKRLAIEQAGTYIESYSKVTNYQLTHDEIQVLASGILEVQILDKKRTVVSNGINFWVKIKAKAYLDKIDLLASKVQERIILQNLKVLQEEYEKNQKEIEDLKKKLKEVTSLKDSNRIKTDIAESEKQFKSNEWVEKGIKLLLSKDIDTATVAFKTALEFSEKNARAHIGLAGVYWINKKEFQAIGYLTKFILNDPRNDNAFLMRGWSYYDLHEYDKAIYDFSRAIAINPFNSDAYYARARAYQKRGPTDMAFQDYSKAIAINPGHRLSIVYRLNLYLKEKKYESGVIDCNKLIDINPKDAWAYGMRASFFSLMGREERAIEDYSTAISFNSKEIGAYEGRGFLYFTKGQYLKALNDYRKVIDLEPNNANAYYYLGESYYRIGDIRQATMNLGEAAKLGNIDARNRLSVMVARGKEWFDKGMTSFSGREWDNAIDNFTKVIAVNPEYPISYGYRGSAYKEKGLYDKAIEDFSKVIEIVPNDVSAYTIRGIIYYIRKQYDNALKDFGKVISIIPNNPGPYTNRGFIYLDVEKYQLAKDNFLKANELNEQYPFPYVGLAILYFKQGKKEESINYYAKAMDYEPLFKEGVAWFEREKGYYYSPSNKIIIENILREVGKK